MKIIACYFGLSLLFPVGSIGWNHCGLFLAKLGKFGKFQGFWDSYVFFIGVLWTVFAWFLGICSGLWGLFIEYARFKYCDFGGVWLKMLYYYLGYGIGFEACILLLSFLIGFGLLAFFFLSSSYFTLITKLFLGLFISY